MNGSFQTDFIEMLWMGMTHFISLMRFGLTWGQEHLASRIVGAVVIVGLFWLIRSVITTVILKNIEWLILRNNPKIKERILDEIEKPIAFIPLILGIYVGLEYLMPDMDLKYKVPLFMSLGSISLFWILYNIVHPMAYLFAQITKTNLAITEWIVRLLRIVLVVVGISSVLEMWGIEVAPIIAGLGLFGMAVALGAQDVFKNILAGLAIVSEKRFQVGQRIKLKDDIEGVVENIGLRSTLIRRYDKAPVYVPNSDLADTAVINFSERTNRQILWKLGLEYRTSSQQLKYIRTEVEDYILNEDSFSRPPESVMEVRFDSFSDSAIILMVYCFSASQKWTSYLESKEKLLLKIKEIVEKAGANFAYSSQSLYVEQLLSDKSPRGKITDRDFRGIEEKEKKNKKKLAELRQPK